LNRTLARIVAIIGIVGFVAAAGLFIYLRSRKPETKFVVPPHLRKGFGEGKETLERLRELDALRKLLKEDRAEGIKRLEAFAAAHPNTSEAGEAHLLIAEALGEQGNVSEALKHIPPAIAAPGGPRRATRARLLRAKLLAPSDPQAARKDLQAVLDDDLHPDLQLEARFLIGRLELAAGNFDQAIATLGPLTERNYPQKKDALKAIREAIEAKLAALSTSGDPKAVLRWGDQMARRFPQVEGLAEVVRFRQAEALRKLGQFARARQILGELTARKDALGPELDLPAELARVAQAEVAAGVVRTREAFMAAKRQGKETRRAFEGEVSADTRWSAADGPLVLTGKTTVAEGATLTIEAGLTVHFVTGAQLVVEGALVAKGTVEKPITLTSVATRDPSPFDGEGVVIAKSSAGRSVLDRCLFEFQRVGLSVVGASPLIRDCTFRRNGQAGLAVERGSPRLEGVNLFVANTGSGIRTEGADVVIRRCAVARNSGDGIALAGKSNPRVEACRIVGNARAGIVADNFASPTIVGCEIADNRGDGIACSRFAQAKILECIIRDNAGAGIRCTRNSDPEITGNLITGNRGYPIVLDRSNGLIKGNLVVANRPYGINMAAAASPRIEGNWLEGNGGCEIICSQGSTPIITRNAILARSRAISNTTTSDIQARENYFGKVSEKRMAEILFDKDDQKSVGRIIWRPALDEPPPRPPEPKLELPPLPAELGLDKPRPERRRR